MSRHEPTRPQEPPPDRSRGYIELFAAGRVTGWFVDRRRVPERIFTLHVDEVELGRFETHVQREDVLAAEGELVAGFDVDVTAALAALALASGTSSGTRHGALSLRSAAGTVVARATIDLDSTAEQLGCVMVEHAEVACLGQLDSFDGAVQHGWFFDPSASGSGHSFVLELDGQALGAFRTSIARDDVLRKVGAREAGFAVDLVAAVEALTSGVGAIADGLSHEVALFDMGGALVASRVVTGPSPTAGYLERCDAGAIVGWATDVRAPHAPVRLALLVDGVHVLHFDTSSHRTDVPGSGAPNAAGFRLDWPEDTFAPGTAIDVRFASTGASLANAPWTITTSRATTAARRSVYLDAHRGGRVRAVTIVIFLHDAPDSLRGCVARVLKFTRADVPIVLIDDARAEPPVVACLDELARHPRIRVERNATNVGFTRSVVAAMAARTDDDIVLLDGDVEVTEGWLERLRFSAYAGSRVATVTPLCDDGGPVSVQTRDTASESGSTLRKADHARAITDAGDGRHLDVPFGARFCLYVRRDALDDVGPFDGVKYTRGRGEEIDFCLRARRRGWTNVVTDKVFVFKPAAARSRSEADERRLSEAFPEYRTLVDAHESVEHAYIRARAQSAVEVATDRRPRPRILFVISSRTGGTPQTNLDLMLALEPRVSCWLLQGDARTFTLFELVDGALVPRESFVLLRAIDPLRHRSDEYDRLVQGIIHARSIALVHVRHVAWHSLGLAQAARSIGVPVVCSFHDFYAVCPAHNLLDEQLNHCGGRCTPDSGQCAVDLWPAASIPPLKHRFVHAWRAMFAEFLADCSEFVTTSPSAAVIVADAHPSLRDRVTCIPHGRGFSAFEAYDTRALAEERIRVLVPGNISRAKGARLITALAERDRDGRFEFHFLGAVASELREVGVHHGTYDRADFAAKVRAIRPALGIVLSIWPETYCHTLTEMWSVGLPVLALDTGAVGERMRASGAGWLLPVQSDAATVHARLVAIVADQAAFAERVAAVRRWQGSEGVSGDIATMAAAYRRVYASAARGSNVDLAWRRVGILSATTDSAQSAWCRLMLEADIGDGFDIRIVDASWFLSGGASELDALLVESGALAGDDALRAVLAETATRHGTRISYDADLAFGARATHAAEYRTRGNDEEEDDDLMVAAYLQAVFS